MVIRIGIVTAILLWFLPAIHPARVIAQEGAEGNGLWRSTKNLSRKVANNSSVKVGLNIGATTPLRIPDGVSLASYAPQFAPIIALETDLFIGQRFIINCGAQMEYKGMRTRSRVRDFYTEVVQEDEGSLVRVAGHFTGTNVTDVNLTYITVPLRLGFWFTSRFAAKLGAYVSYAIGRRFTGYVEDGYLWTKPHETTGMSNKLLVPHADFDFSREMRRWDWGADLALTTFISRRFFMDLGATVGMGAVQHSHFSGLPFRLHNVYVSVSLGYRFAGAPQRHMSEKPFCFLAGNMRPLSR